MNENKKNNYMINYMGNYMVITCLNKEHELSLMSHALDLWSLATEGT